MSNERPVFQGSHLALSMRNSGYRNTAYALAEIIDNSVEAKARNIEIMCAEEVSYDTSHPTTSIVQIAVADNGIGMTEDELWNSLIMGEGTRHEAKGIGKYGMGLPHSSMSQCRHVTVYSWKSPDSVLSVEMDLDGTTGQGLSVKKPQKSMIPEIWLKHSKHLKNAKSGTLVIWNKLDRIQWKKAKTLTKNLERIVGRVYRKFLVKGKLEISSLSFDVGSGTSDEPYAILPNDPLYLTVPSSTPPPWDNEPMFRIDGDELERRHPINGYDVIVRCTLAKKDAREVDGTPAGSLAHGKHANSNLGISVIRADRELYVDTNLCQTYDPLERWWGVEVEFPTALDEVFGVSYTKQDASHFSAMTHTIGAMTRNEIDDKTQYDDEDSDLRDLVVAINARIVSMRKVIKKQRRKSPTPDPPPTPWPDPEPGPTITSTQDKTMSDKQKEKALIEALRRMHDPDTASEKAKGILKDNIKTQFETAPLGIGEVFFGVSFNGGVILITINSDHPAYKHLIEMTTPIPNDIELEDAKEILEKLHLAINALFVSWAQYENHTVTDSEREQVVYTRQSWSRQLSKLVQAQLND